MLEELRMFVPIDDTPLSFPRVKKFASQHNFLDLSHCCSLESYRAESKPSLPTSNKRTRGAVPSDRVTTHCSI